MAQKPTKQGRATRGHPPKERQFGQPNGNPRHNGAWKKEDTARYKLERMMELSEAELTAVCNDPDAPTFEKKLATAIQDGKWSEISDMINQVYGKPKERVDVKAEGQGFIVEVIDRREQIDD